MLKGVFSLMRKAKWPFQKLALQKDLQDITQEPTAVLPALRLLPGEHEEPTALLPAITLPIDEQPALASSLPVTPLPAGAITMPQYLEEEQRGATEQEFQEEALPAKPAVSRKKKMLRGAALTLCLLLLLALYLVWHTSTSASTSPTITQQNMNGISNAPGGNATTTGSNVNTTSGAIQVYVLGAVKNPGVYTLPADARVYQLLQAAGGTLPDADLVALNLAAKLSDGEEVYVLTVGETPPDNLNATSPGGSSNATATVPSGQLVNINTATATEMEQQLHVSSTTANKIITYRTQHGRYTSVDQLLQVVSKTIYDRIKNMVTV
jgi:competence protein ComEA